jgi:hypothetical protein
MWSRILVVLLFLVQSGCVTHVTPEQVASADYGTLTASYKDAIQNYMETKLYDPESARYRWTGEPVRGYAYVQGAFKPPEFGYLVQVNINAKNRLGGYVGAKPFTFLVRNDTVWMLTKWTTKQVNP